MTRLRAAWARAVADLAGSGSGRRSRERAARVRSLCLVLGLLLHPACSAGPGSDRSESPLSSATVRERLGARVPAAIVLTDHRGRRASLQQRLGPGPTLLVLGYYHCEMLCELVFDGLARALSRIESAHGEPGPYRVIAVSIDPRDDAASAAQRREPLVAELGWGEARWPFLTGAEADVRSLATEIGFGYRYDPDRDQYAHPALVTVLSPAGRVSSYLYGIEPGATQLARALDVAREGGTRSPIQRVLLRCFHYVPALREYAGALTGYFRLGGLLILGLLGAGLAWLVRAARERRGAG